MLCARNGLGRDGCGGFIPSDQDRSRNADCQHRGTGDDFDFSVDGVFHLCHSGSRITKRRTPKTKKEGKLTGALVTKVAALFAVTGFRLLRL